MTTVAPYTVGKEDLESISDLDIAFGTTNLLPAWDQIPDDFKASRGNKYTQLVDTLFAGNQPEGTIELNEGIEPEMLSRAVRAHLRSFAPKHEHKIAGIAYMISRLATVD